MTQALSTSTSNKFEREAEVQPWFPFQAGEPETAKAGHACHAPRRRNQKTCLGGDGWMDGSAPLNIRKR